MDGWVDKWIEGHRDEHDGEANRCRQKLDITSQITAISSVEEGRSFTDVIFTRMV